MIIKGMNSEDMLSDIKIDGNLIRKARVKVYKDIHPPKGHKNWWEDVCDPVPRSTMKLKFKTELRDDYKQEMVNAEQRDIQHKTDKRTYR